MPPGTSPLLLPDKFEKRIASGPKQDFGTRKCRAKAELNFAQQCRISNFGGHAAADFEPSRVGKSGRNGYSQRGRVAGAGSSCHGDA